MKVVDTRGCLCPEPLILTRRALDGAQVGDSFEVIADNVTAKGNLLNFLGELGIDAICGEKGGQFFITFTLGQAVASGVVAENFCTPVSVNSGVVVVLKSEFMGGGDKELGALLMRAFLNSLSELQQLPSAVVAYNGGVKLCVDGADSALALAKLKERGVRIVACGTCVDFFEIGNMVSVAQIGNMLLIGELTMSAQSVIYP